LRIVLFGYGEMGCAALEFLRAGGEDVAAVITHRDNPAEKQWFRSLAKLAATNRTPTLIGEDLDLRKAVADLRPDLILSFYYRDMIPTKVLALAPQGALNLHGSKLPRLRGRAPLNWALVECEEETGVTLHHMVKAPDAGDIVAQRSWRIGPRDTAKDLFDRAVVETRTLMRDIWPAIRAGTAPRIPQDETKATYRGRRTPEDGKIDWSLPARRIDGLVRAVTDPFPGAFTFLDGTKLMVWAGEPVPGRGPAGSLIGERIVATGEGAYRIDRWTAPDGSSPRLTSGMTFEGVRT
jgi:methionyl-tRNA formyltransferase